MGLDPALQPPDKTGASDHSLLQRYRGGNQDAATELYLRYAQRLRGLARAGVSPGLARQVEVDDLVQSVFGSFFRGVHDALYDVPAGEDLWKLLLVIALHKIRNKANYHHAAKRDTRRNTNGVAVEAFLQAQTDQDTAAWAFLQIVIDEAMASLSPQQKQIAELRMEGLDVAAIAVKTERSKRTVERLLQQVRVKLSGFFAESP